MNQAGNADNPAFDRRAIPAHARESIWHARDGFAVRRIDWAGATPDNPRGSILFYPGRGDCYEKYLESLEQWHRAGWRVTSADWRGQAGSGRFGDDAITGHISDFSVWVDDLAAFWKEWVVSTPGPHVLAAHSMGGHIVTRGLVEGKVSPDAVFMVAPMLRIVGPRLPLSILHGTAKVMLKLGSPKRQAWKWGEKPGEVPKHRIMLLTHDKDRYEDELFWRDKRPELVMGPGSWGWVERAYASIDVIEREGAMEAVETPVFIASTSFDKLVNHKSCVKAAERFPNGELLKFGMEARHEILREVDPVRDRLMGAIDAFLDRNAPRQKGDAR